MNEDMLDDIAMQSMQNMLVGLSKLVLNNKKHIKKYNHLRKLHGEILDNMQDYMFSDKYDMVGNFNEILKLVQKPGLNVGVQLYPNNADDITVIMEMFVYKHHTKIKAITDIYLEKNKFRNEEKVKMLNCMKNSYASLFKVVGVDSSNGYIIYEDVYTKKRYQIIDIAMSSTYNVSNGAGLYRYDRLITYDDITFGSGIHCAIRADNNELKAFLKNRDNKKLNDIVKCLSFYTISKNSNDIKATYHDKY